MPLHPAQSQNLQYGLSPSPTLLLFDPNSVHVSHTCVHFVKELVISVDNRLIPAVQINMVKFKDMSAFVKRTFKRLAHKIFCNLCSAIGHLQFDYCVQKLAHTQFATTKT